MTRSAILLAACALLVLAHASPDGEPVDAHEVTSSPDTHQVTSAEDALLGESDSTAASLEFLGRRRRRRRRRAPSAAAVAKKAVVAAITKSPTPPPTKKPTRSPTSPTQAPTCSAQLPCACSGTGCSIDQTFDFVRDELKSCAPLLSATGTAVKYSKNGTMTTGKGPLTNQGGIEYYKDVDIKGWLRLYSQSRLARQGTRRVLDLKIRKLQIPVFDGPSKLGKPSFSKAWSWAKKAASWATKTVNKFKEATKQLGDLNKNVRKANRKLDVLKELELLESMSRGIVLVSETAPGTISLGEAEATSTLESVTSGRRRRRRRPAPATKSPTKAPTRAPTFTPDIFAACETECTVEYIARPSFVQEVLGGSRLGESTHARVDFFRRRRRRRKAATKDAREAATKDAREAATKDARETQHTAESMDKDCRKGDKFWKKGSGFFARARKYNGVEYSKNQACRRDPSLGFGGSSCLSCQHRLCVQKYGAGRCWKCDVLMEGTSLGYSCSRHDGIASTVCKALVTDEDKQGWIGVEIDDANCVPDGKGKKCGAKSFLRSPTSVAAYPLFKEITCTKADDKTEKCQIQKRSPCTLSSKSTNYCAVTETLVDSTRAF